MPDCGVHYLWFAFVCFLIRSHPPPLLSGLPAMLPHPRLPEKPSSAQVNSRGPAVAKPAAVPGAKSTNAPQAGMDDAARLAAELQASWDACQSLPLEHATAAATNLQLRLAPLPSMATAMRSVGQATTGKQLGAILTSQAGFFGADSGAAASALADWRGYLAERRLLQGAPSSKQELLDTAQGVDFGVRLVPNPVALGTWRCSPGEADQRFA